MGNDIPVTELSSITDKFSCNSKGEIKQTLGNCILAICNDGELKGKIKYNLLSNKIDIVGRTHWKREGATLTDNDVNNIRLYLEQNYGLTSEKGIPRALSIIAHQNSYHPVRDLLDILEWDGQDRISNILPKYLGADSCEYTTEAMKIFMLGAINRVYKPGSKFDLMLCLVGLKQGEGKSTLFRLLAINDEWYSDDLKKLDDENIYRKLQGHWIIEMAEMLATANAKSVEEIKAFITRQKETYKIPYETHPQDRPRQCVLCGTTNNMEFLPKDASGNRRFIPVLIDKEKAEVHPLQDEAETRQYLIDAWAEAMYIYKSRNYSLTFSKKMNEQLIEQQKDFITEDANVGIIQEWLDAKAPDCVCSFMIFREALGNPFDKPESWQIKSINLIMNNSITGWEKYPTSDTKKRFEKYGKQRAWQRIIGDTSFEPIEGTQEELNFLS